MKKSKKRIGEYWDNLILKFIPPYADSDKFQAEIKEHFNFISLMFKRIIIPVLLIYIVIALILNINIFGSIFISLIIFIYSNFLPDIDFLIKYSERKESLWYEKYFVLFFAPIFFYYVLIGRANPIKSKKARCFHNLMSALIWALFLLIVGHIFWDENIKIMMFICLGFFGYCFHLGIDGIISLENFILRKKSADRKS